MGLWQQMKRWFRRERRQTISTWSWDGWGGPVTPAGVVVTPEAALRQAVVFRCVRLLAETIATLPLHVYRRTGEDSWEIARGYRLYELLHNQPNQLMTATTMIEMMMSSCLLRGEAFAHVVRNDWDGSVMEIIPIHPDRVLKQVQPGGREIAYLIDGGKYVLRAGEVWHVMAFTLDGINALTPIALNRNTIGLALAAEEHGAQVFSQAARPSGVLVHPGKLKDEARKRLAEHWQSQFSGRGVGRVAVLEEGMQWQPLTMTAEDAQYIQTREFQAREIAMMFGVPPHKVGDLGRATWANIEHQNMEWVQDTLRAWARKFEQSARRDLLLPSERDEFKIEFSLEGLLRGDTKTRYESYSIAIQTGIMSPNEARRLENLPPYPGGDEFIRPLNMGAVTPSLPAGQVSEAEAEEEIADGET